MSFDQQQSTREAIEAELAARKEREARVLRSRNSAGAVISPTVIRVLDRFRESVLPQMATHVSVSEERGYHLWAIYNGEELEDSPVVVRPRYSDTGTIDGLCTSLQIPAHFLPLIETVANERGLQFERTPLNSHIISATVRHSPNERELTAALVRLFPADLLKILLVELKATWHVGDAPRPKSQVAAEAGSGCLLVFLLIPMILAVCEVARQS